MENLDLELLIISNQPIAVDKLTIYPTSIKEIAKFGYTKYNQALKILCMTNREIKDLINVEMSIFEFLQMNMTFDASLKELLNQTLSLIFRASVRYSDSKQAFIVGGNLLNKDNFQNIANIIAKINCLSEYEESKENPSNEKARMILEKRRKLKQKLMKHQQENNLLQISEIVSIVAVSQKMAINDVIEYNLYQLIDQFMRIISKENYETNLNALLHGADNEKLDLQHWTQKSNKSGNSN